MSHKELLLLPPLHDLVTPDVSRPLGSGNNRLTWITNNIPTAIVVPNARPKANKEAANADNPKGIIGRGSLLAMLISILTELQPKETYKRETRLQDFRKLPTAEENQVTQ